VVAWLGLVQLCWTGLVVLLVGAGAVVTDVPDGAIVVGAPVVEYAQQQSRREGQVDPVGAECKTA